MRKTYLQLHLETDKDNDRVTLTQQDEPGESFVSNEVAITRDMIPNVISFLEKFQDEAK